MREVSAGMFARSLAGHDKGTLSLICGTEDVYLMLADGRTRTADHPKKKKIRHTQVDYTILPEIAEKLASGQKLTDQEIRAAVRKKARGGEV